MLYIVCMQGRYFNMEQAIKLKNERNKPSDSLPLLLLLKSSSCSSSVILPLCLLAMALSALFFVYLHVTHPTANKLMNNSYVFDQDHQIANELLI